MRMLLDHTLLLFLSLSTPYVFSFVARPPAQAPVQVAKTYEIYDAAATEDAGRARMTPGLHPRQLMNPDSDIARYFASRPTAYPSVPYAPASVNNTEVCVLWDPTCHGNKDEALKIFFERLEKGGVMARLLDDSCFTTGPDWNSHCTEDPKPDESLIKYWSTVRSFMRQTSCQASRNSAHELVSTIPAYSEFNDNCCGACGIGGPNVDVYYWESPNANTDCLSIIGTEVKPPLEGATTVGNNTYWGTITSPGVQWHSVKTTMIYTSINGVYFKQPLSNPWDDPNQVNKIMKNAQGPQSATSSRLAPTASAIPPVLQARANLRPINPRQAKPLNESYGIGMSGVGRASIVTYNGHVFTSPSIYVDFYSLRATDQCGYLGSQNIITSTLLPFAPGELSTYGGPLTSIAGQNHVAPTMYNFDELPCPPKSIMYDQWYMPEPGQPYRPIIAFPTKLNGIDPAWAKCTPRLFSGLDPPRDLAHATGLVPPNVEPQKQSDDLKMTAIGEEIMNLPSKDKSEGGPMEPGPVPEKDPQQQLAPEQSDSCRDSCNVPAENLPAKENPPTKEITLLQNPPPQPNPPESHQQPSEQKIQKTDDAKQVVSDPDKVSDEDMSKIHEALQPSKPDAQAQPAPAKAPVPDTGAIDKPKEQVAVAKPAPPQPIASVGGQPITPITKNSPANNNAAPANDQAAVAKGDPANEQAGDGPTHDKAPAKADSPQVYQVGNNKVTAGGPPITIDNTRVSAPSNGGVVVGKETYHAAPAVVPTTSSLAGHKVVAGPDGYKIDNEPLKPGSPVTAANGQVARIDNNNQIHLGEQVVPIARSAAPITTIGNQPITPLGNGQAVVGGQTLHQGGAPINLHGTPYSLNPAGSLVVDNKAFALPSANPQPTTINGEKVIPQSDGGVSIHGTTLVPGGKAITINNRPISLDKAGDIHFAEQSFTLPPVTSSPTSPHMTSVNGEAVVPLSNGAVSVHETTLTPGAKPITNANGEVISLGTNGLVIGSSTLAPSVLSSLASQPSTPNTATTINGEEVKPVASGISIAGATLTPGAAVTKSNGEVISLGTDGLIVGSETVSVTSGGQGFTVAGSITPAGPGAGTVGKMASVGGTGSVPIEGLPTSSGGPFNSGVGRKRASWWVKMGSLLVGVGLVVV